MAVAIATIASTRAARGNERHPLRPVVIERLADEPAIRRGPAEFLRQTSATDPVSEPSAHSPVMQQYLRIVLSLYKIS